MDYKVPEEMGKSGWQTSDKNSAKTYMSNIISYLSKEHQHL